MIKKSSIELDGFPGGPDGFELVLRFCHSNGGFEIDFSNVGLLHCCAVFLETTETVSSFNLLKKTDEFLAGIDFWSLNEIVASLKSCEAFFEFADSETGLVKKLVCALLAKIAQNPDSNSKSTSSSSSSPETGSGFRLSSQNTPESVRLRSGLNQTWWFSEMTVLPPVIIERVIKTMENNHTVLTKFLLHYLKKAPENKASATGYGVLADVAGKGVIFMGKTSFSCRGLFWVLWVLSGHDVSQELRHGLERLIGGVLDEATLDDLLVSGQDRSVYDVSLVLRLLRLFVDSNGVSGRRMKKVGRLVDEYLGEIAPDQSLRVSKFLAVAESLPDSARMCFDGVYRAIDIYLQSHPNLSSDDRLRLCRCLNYKKLTLEACKDIAKNPKTPPRVAIQALMSQQVSVGDEPEMVLYKGIELGDFSDENEEMRLNLEKMQWRVKELERVCGEMKKMVKHRIVACSSPRRASLPRLC